MEILSCEKRYIFKNPKSKVLVNKIYISQFSKLPTEANLNTLAYKILVKCMYYLYVNGTCFYSGEKPSLYNKRKCTHNSASCWYSFQVFLDSLHLVIHLILTFARISLDITLCTMSP